MVKHVEEQDLHIWIQSHTRVYAIDLIALSFSDAKDLFMFPEHNSSLWCIRNALDTLHQLISTTIIWSFKSWAKPRDFLSKLHMGAAFGCKWLPQIVEKVSLVHAAFFRKRKYHRDWIVQCEIWDPLVNAIVGNAIFCTAIRTILWSKLVFSLMWPLSWSTYTCSRWSH